MGKHTCMESDKKQTVPSITERIATHEAGHGVLYAVLFQNLRNFRLIYSNHNNKNDPCLDIGHNHSFTEKKEAINLIAIALGGRLAEIIKYGKNFDEKAYAADYRSIENVIKKSVHIPLLRQSTGRSKQDIINDILQTEHHYMVTAGNIAQQTLGHFWPVVEKVAKRLMIKDVVSGDEIHEIVAAHMLSSINKPTNELHI